MDLSSLSTDFESALLNWDVDEVNNAQVTNNHDHPHFNDDGKQKNMLSSTALAAVTTTTTNHDATTSLPSLPKQQELIQHVNYHQQVYQPQPGLNLTGSTANNAVSILDANPIPQASYYQVMPSSSDTTTASNNITPNFYPNHTNTAAHQNNSNLLLNGFVTTMDDKLPTATVHQSNSQTVLNNASGSSSASSGAAANGQTMNTDKTASSTIRVEQQLQQQQRAPQHLQLEGATNPFWHLQDSSSNNRSSSNVGVVLPTNYFLPGMVSCDPFQTQPNSTISSSTKVPGMDMATGGGAVAGLDEYAFRTKTDDSKSTSISLQSNVTHSSMHPLQQQQQHNQLNISNTSVTPWGQHVPQHQIQSQNGLQLSQTNPIIATETVINQPSLAAQNVQNSQMNNNNTVVDGSLSCGTNNVSVHHQSMCHLNGSGYGSNQPIGTSPAPTTNGVNNIGETLVPVGIDTGQQSQQISQSAPFQYVTTNTTNEDSLSSSNGISNSSCTTTFTYQKRQQQDSPPKSKPAKKARKNSSTTGKKKKGSGDTDTAPPFYLFDAPCELRTNFIQAQHLNNITVVQDNNAYHYGMAVNGFHPQLNAQANPPIQPTTKTHNSSSSSSSSHNTPENVVLLDGRHKNKIRQGNERNEREQQRAQKITELIDKLRLTMVNGGWKNNEMKSKYQTLSTCAAYVKYLIQETKKKEAAIEKARSNLAIRNQKLEEDKSLQESRSDPESVTSSLTTSSAFRTGDERKSGECGGLEVGKSSRPSMRVISSSSGGGSDDHNNSKSSDSEKNDSAAHAFFSDVQNEKARVNTVGTDSQASSADGSVSGPDSCDRPEGQNISLHKRNSSMSEISDSTLSSNVDSGTGSDSGDCTSGGSIDLTISGKNSSSDECEDLSEASIVSSTAAVMSGFGSKEQDNIHPTAMVKESIGDRKRKHEDREKTSLEGDFELNYQEVFLASNIPQLIATQTGRIAICNDFFHSATGMSEQDMQRITIFSIVQADKLSTLFELVATSIRQSKKPSSADGCITDTSAGPWSSSNDDAPYKTVTLPCIPFPKGMKSKAGEDEEEVLRPLFMAVTFIADDNPRNRCIHCILTEEAPGSGSKIGPMTPTALKKMFTKNGSDMSETPT